MEYKGKQYRTRTLIVEDSFREPVTIRIAPVSLYEAMGGEGPFLYNSLEETIDDSIYYYVQDEAINYSAEVICVKYLDEPFFLIEEI